MCNVSATMQTPHTRRSRSALYDSTVEYKDHNTRTFLTVKSVMVETTVEKKNLVVTSKHSTTPPFVRTSCLSTLLSNPSVVNVIWPLPLARANSSSLKTDNAIVVSKTMMPSSSSSASARRRSRRRSRLVAGPHVDEKETKHRSRETKHR